MCVCVCVCVCVGLCVHTFKHKYLRNQWADGNQILSEASLGRGKTAFGFGSDRIRKCCQHSSTFIFEWIVLKLQVTSTFITSRRCSKFGQIEPRTAELAALERRKNSPKTYGENVVNTLAPSFLIGSSSFL